MKVLISTSSFGKAEMAPLEVLKEKNLEVMLNPHKRKLTKEEISELIPGVDGLIAGTEPLSRDVLEKADRLRVISRLGTGMDNVDMNAADEKGIKVYRTPAGPSLAVAELTMGFILDALRYKSCSDRTIRKREWDKKMGNLLTGNVVGIIGTGFIGKKLVEMLKPFNCKILAFDVQQDKEWANDANVTYVPINEVLAEATVVSVHLPLTDSTRKLFDEDLFGRMKDGAIFINTSRGEVVDEDALYAALKNNLRYACLDVYNQEPYVGKLSELDNVTLTCHIGAYAQEARNVMEMDSVVNLLTGLEIV